MAVQSGLILDLLDGLFTICQLPASSDVPLWAISATVTELLAVVRSREELSIVCPAGSLPPDAPDVVARSDGWRVLRVEGPLDVKLTGILASLLTPLAEARIPVFALATFQTDWLLLPDEDIVAAIAALREAGHIVRD